MGLLPTKVHQDVAITPRGDCLQCPKRSAMRFQLSRQWTLRAVPGPRAASSKERIFKGADFSGRRTSTLQLPRTSSRLVARAVLAKCPFNRSHRDKQFSRIFPKRDEIMMQIKLPGSLIDRFGDDADGSHLRGILQAPVEGIQEKPPPGILTLM